MVQEGASRASERGFRLVLFITLSLDALVIPVAFLTGRSIWALDAVVLGGAYAGVWAIRRDLRLTPVLLGMVGVLVLAHTWSVLGMFKMTLLGLEYDSYIHTYSNLVVGLIAIRYMGKFGLGLPERIFAAFLLVLGVGLLNELVEYTGYLIGGQGEGLFLLGPGDIGATNAFENLMTDFLHDALGGVAGLLLGLLTERVAHAPGTEGISRS